MAPACLLTVPPEACFSVLPQNDIVIFLGPSMPASQAAERLPATYLPPAEQGDLLGAVLDLKPRVIVLIDGVFLSRPAVWHREVLFALSRGVHVFGASSMGALRASELASFGMRGVGEIFAGYADGSIVDDDEVALTHSGADQEHRPLTEAMVNVRSTVAAAVQAGVVSQAQAQGFLNSAKQLFFAERSRKQMFRHAIAAGALSEDSPLPAFFRDHYVDQKRMDAEEVLQVVSGLPADLGPFVPEFPFSENRLFQTLLHRDAALYEGKARVRRGDVASWFALHDDRFDSFNFNALNRTLVQLLADILEVKVDEDEVASERRRFKLKQNLIEQEAFDAWLQANHISAESFGELMRQRAVCRRLHQWLWLKHGRLGSVAMLTEELHLQNEYLPALQRVTLRQEMQDRYSPFLVESEGDQDLPVHTMLREHVVAEGVRLDQHFTGWFKEANFASLNALAAELIRSRHARAAMQQLFVEDGP